MDEAAGSQDLAVKALKEFQLCVPRETRLGADRFQGHEPVFVRIPGFVDNAPRSPAEFAKDFITRFEYWRLSLGILIILVVIVAPEGIVGSLRKLAENLGWTRDSEAAR